MPRWRRPRAVPPGGTLGIAAPAGPVDPERLAAGAARLREAGFRTVWRDDVVARHGYLAGDDARRATELMALLEDPEIDAVVCARGGYGGHRVAPRLDAARVRSAAKPLVGYSDVTTLLLWQRRQAGLGGIHGPMLERGGDLDDGELQALAAALTGRETLPLVRRGRPGGGGRAQGRLVGGSLALVTASLGTPWEIDARGAILLLEEVHEPPYRIDRMLEQLRAAGTLSAVAGIGVGALVDCDPPAGSEAPAAEAVVRECLRSLGVPFVLGLPFGHGRPNLAWSVGVRAAIDGEHGELHILERGVSRPR